MSLRDYQIAIEGGQPVNVADASAFALDLAEDALEHGHLINAGDGGASLDDVRERLAIERHIRARGWR